MPWCCQVINTLRNMSQILNSLLCVFIAGPVVHRGLSRAGKWAKKVSYGSSRDCGSGPVLSSTRGMGQLKGPPPAQQHYKQSLVGWALRPHDHTVKDLLTAGRQEDVMETEGAAMLTRGPESWFRVELAHNTEYGTVWVTCSCEIL